MLFVITVALPVYEWDYPSDIRIRNSLLSSFTPFSPYEGYNTQSYPEIILAGSQKRNIAIGRGDRFRPGRK
ncbi:hypothetical protein AB6A40_009426 [Gnathostoma spinigerum]|uniref:Uncharacterized protein n=1 Tax=Gnathostoma spinigerum TaxID=75299 RepID=A0ABD6F0T1_9BILA